MLPDLRENKTIAGLVREHYRAYYGPLTPNWAKLAMDVLNLEREHERIEKLEGELSISMPGRDLLEIGSGFGLFVSAAHAAGARAFGIEPDAEACRIARLVLDASGAKDTLVSRAPGEALPYADGAFDLICSFQVLEHTQNPAAVVAEALRVTRPGGLLYFVIPNYNSFWESHYGVLWLPRLNRRVGKWYLRRKGRDPAFLDTIQYITPKLLQGILARLESKCEVLSWGTDVWRKRLVERDVTKWGQTGPLQKIVQIASALRLTRLVAWLGGKLDFYYPIILVLRRI